MPPSKAIPDKVRDLFEQARLREVKIEFKTSYEAKMSRRKLYSFRVAYRAELVKTYNSADIPCPWDEVTIEQNGATLFARPTGAFLSNAKITETGV